MSVVQVRNAFKEYHSKAETKVVLKNFNMNVNQGAIYSLMGSSGCGKTTLISSLVGLMELDKGSVSIFGEPFVQNRARIGYMPQETALLNEFTVREMIWFYGTVYGLSSDKIDERFRFLSMLLELPSYDRLIVDCSGGQQRRISFALTLVHEPEMLILDEPTVGVDPMLRAKIWDYLVDLTRTKNVTVLLSTHYIEEAKQSTHIGLMRNGVQLAEDSPQNILQACEATSLDEAFLTLSQKQEHQLLVESDNQTLQQISARHTLESETPTNASIKTKRKRIITAQSDKSILKALCKRNFIQFFRNHQMVATFYLLPIICCFGMHYGVGGRIKDLKLGIVNDEVDYKEQCANRSLVTTELVGDRCTLKKASCRFIDDLEDDVIEKIFYESRDEAYDAGKRGNIVGYIYFASNYTESMITFKEDFLDYSEEGSIQVQLDHTDLQKISIVRQQLYDTYSKFIRKLSVLCGLPEKAGDVVAIRFDAIFGKLGFDFRQTVVPGIVICGYFFMTSYLLSATIVTDRVDGTWNRTIVAGAKPYLFLTSRLIEGIIQAFLSFLIYGAYAMFILTPGLSINAMLLLSMIIFLNGCNGLACGLMFSVVMKNAKVSLMLTLTSAYPAVFLGGIAWPFEGMPKALQFISNLFPFTHCIEVYRKIITRNMSIQDQAVYLTILILILWIAGQIYLCFWWVREEKPKIYKK